MGKRKFKTESKKLLDLMINSIYTNKEIFLRELVSNASDAIDKYHFKSLTDDLNERNYEITISVNKNDRSITITDNGIGMTEDELNDNLGTIAKSGSKEFLEKLSNKDEVEIIGQFGVGFYASFMVADKVEVLTKSAYSEKAYLWTSGGEDTYEVKESLKDSDGTEITLYLRETDDYEYGEFLEEYKLKGLIKKYSDYVKYPIKMNISKVVEDETIMETETINSMKPIWKKAKSEISDEEVNEFYKHQFMDFEDPLKVIHTNVEGMLTYTSMVFIPKKAPFDLHSKNYEKGLQLYSKGVFIMDKCKELVPEWMLFVKGLVDTSDLSLNISREMLQQSKQLTQISSALEKKVKNELKKMLDKERESYIEFWNTYGVNVKYGIYESYGAKKDLLKDLLIFKTSHNEYVTLTEYIENMKEDQVDIYYATGSSKEQIQSLPQMDMLKDKDFEVLFLTDEIDEFMINILNEFDDKMFKSINKGDLDLASEEEKEEIKSKEKTSKNLLNAIKDSLKDKVTDVKLSTRLKDSPVCLVADDGLSFEMEKVLAQMPDHGNMKANRILEINPNHELFISLETIYNKDKLEINNYAEILLSQALLIEGLPIENPVEFSNKMCDLIIKSSK